MIPRMTTLFGTSVNTDPRESVSSRGTGPDVGPLDERRTRGGGGTGRSPGSCGCSGQAMTEAVIALCLLSFTWLISSYMLSMAENRVRCAAVGRHAAWMQAHAPTTFFNPATTLTPHFIRHDATVAPVGTPSTRSVSTGGANPNATLAKLLAVLNLDSISIQHVEQSLTINHSDDQPLYAAHDQEVRLMRDVFQGVGSVGVATCEWATVDTLLESRATMLSVTGTIP